MKLIVIFLAFCFGCSVSATKGRPLPPPPPRKGGHPNSPDKTGNGWGNGNGWDNGHHEQHGWGNGHGWNNGGWGGEDNTVPSYETPPTCLDRQKIPIQNHFDSDLFNNERLWYVSGATKYEYITTAQKFLGRAPRDQREMGEMCLTEIFGPSDFVINNGYGRQYQQYCTDENQPPGQENCTVIDDRKTYDGKLGVKPYLGDENQLAYLVKTDSETYIIYYICSDGKFGHIQLLTTRPFAHPSVVNTYIDLAENLGFHVTEIQLLYCLYPHFNLPYPRPFEHYPHSPGNQHGTGWGWIQEKPNHGWSVESIGWGPGSDGWTHSQSNSGWGEHSGWSQNHGSGWNGKEAKPKAEVTT